MKRIITLLLTALLPLLLFACSRKPAAGPQGWIETSAGKEFKVVLESNPSTGYHWEAIGELDDKVIELVSREYRADEPVMPGSGGSDVWVFKAVSAGETTITLGYFPPDASAEAQQTHTFTVKVK